MRGFFLLNLALLILVPWNPQNAFADSCSAKDETLVPHMLPRRPQHNTSYCYAFAATALLEQFRCSKLAMGCVADDRLSPLDALAITNYGSGTFAAMQAPGQALAGGYPFETLVKVSRLRPASGLFRESCAPFDAAVNAGARRNGGQVIDPPWRIFRLVHDEYMVQYQLGRAGECTQPIADFLKQAVELQTSAEDIAQALQRREFTFFLKDAVVPKKCENERAAIPPFKPERISSGEFGKVAAKADELLAAKRPFNLSLCHEKNMARFCGPHALVIAGKRTLCCNGVCKEQWKVVDSAGAFQGRDIDADGWVDRASVMERAEGLTRYLSQHKLTTDIMTWISEK